MTPNVIHRCSGDGGLVTLNRHLRTKTACGLRLSRRMRAVSCGLSNLGDVAGEQGILSRETRATIWNRGSLRSRNLGKLAAANTVHISINDAEKLLELQISLNSIVPLVWTATGGLRRIPTLPGDKCGQALGINNYGHVIGYSSGRNGRKLSWTRRAGVLRLGVLPGGNWHSLRHQRPGSGCRHRRARPARVQSCGRKTAY